MIYLLFSLHQCRRHHLQSFTLTSPGVQPNARLPSQYVSVRDLLMLLASSNKSIQLKSSGLSIPLVLSGVPGGAEYGCIGMKNVSEDGQLLWLYTDVPLGNGTFREGRQYQDFGGGESIKTDYQIAHDIEAGYFGPVAWMSFIPTSTLFDYQIFVYTQTSKLTDQQTVSQTQALKQCKKGAYASIPFKSSFGMLMLAMLLSMNLL